jgi:hypothetical protein
MVVVDSEALLATVATVVIRSRLAKLMVVVVVALRLGHPGTFE